MEFSDKDSVQTALALDDSLFKGRQIKVTEKRTNRPGVSTTDRPPRGGLRGFGRGRFPRGGYMPYISAPYRGRMARPYFRYEFSFIFHQLSSLSLFQGSWSIKLLLFSILN